MSVTTETPPDRYTPAPNRLGGSELLHRQAVQIAARTAVVGTARLSDPSAERSRQCVAEAFDRVEHHVTTLDKN